MFAPSAGISFSVCEKLRMATRMALIAKGAAIKVTTVGRGSMRRITIAGVHATANASDDCDG
jgi:hypothetical protein